MTTSKQKKIGVRPETHKAYRAIAKGEGRSMAEIANRAIELYRQSVGEESQSAMTANTSH